MRTKLQHGRPCIEEEQSLDFYNPERLRTQLSRPTTKPTQWQVRAVNWNIRPGIRNVWSVFTVHQKKVWIPGYPESAQQRLWSDWADAQADLIPFWAHRSFSWFLSRSILFSFFINHHQYPFPSTEKLQITFTQKDLQCYNLRWSLRFFYR